MDPVPSSPPPTRLGDSPSTSRTNPSRTDQKSLSPRSQQGLVRSKTQTEKKDTPRPAPVDKDKIKDFSVKNDHLLAVGLISREIHEKNKHWLVHAFMAAIPLDDWNFLLGEKFPSTPGVSPRGTSPNRSRGHEVDETLEIPTCIPIRPRVAPAMIDRALDPSKLRMPPVPLKPEDPAPVRPQLRDSGGKLSSSGESLVKLTAPGSPSMIKVTLPPSRLPAGLPLSAREIEEIELEEQMREIEEEVFGAEEPLKEKQSVSKPSEDPVLEEADMGRFVMSASGHIKMKGQQRKQTPRQPLVFSPPLSPTADQSPPARAPNPSVFEEAEDPILQILKQNYGKHRSQNYTKFDTFRASYIGTDEEFKTMLRDLAEEVKSGEAVDIAKLELGMGL